MPLLPSARHSAGEKATGVEAVRMRMLSSLDARLLVVDSGFACRHLLQPDSSDRRAVAGTALRLGRTHSISCSDHISVRGLTSPHTRSRREAAPSGNLNSLFASFRPLWYIVISPPPRP